jgi:hypothetical protein
VEEHGGGGQELEEVVSSEVAQEEEEALEETEEEEVQEDMEDVVLHGVVAVVEAVVEGFEGNELPAYNCTLPNNFPVFSNNCATKFLQEDSSLCNVLPWMTKCAKSMPN